jgi:hypothetical protein
MSSYCLAGNFILLLYITLIIDPKSSGSSYAGDICVPAGCVNTTPVTPVNVQATVSIHVYDTICPHIYSFPPVVEYHVGSDNISVAHTVNTVFVVVFLMFE